MVGKINLLSSARSKLRVKKIRSAKLILLDSNRDVLILRRSSTHPRAAYKPDLPGGIIEPHESFESGLLRELLEETKLVIKESDLKEFLSTKYKVGPFIHIERRVYVAHLTVASPAIVISWEHDQSSWVKPGTIRELEPFNQTAIEKLAALDQTVPITA